MGGLPLVGILGGVGAGLAGGLGYGFGLRYGFERMFPAYQKNSNIQEAIDVTFHDIQRAMFAPSNSPLIQSAKDIIGLNQNNVLAPPHAQSPPPKTASRQITQDESGRVHTKLKLQESLPISDVSPSSTPRVPATQVTTSTDPSNVWSGSLSSWAKAWNHRVNLNAGWINRHKLHPNEDSLAKIKYGSERLQDLLTKTNSKGESMMSLACSAGYKLRFQ